MRKDEPEFDFHHPAVIGLVARGRCCAYQELHFGLFSVPELKKRGAERRFKGTLDARC